MDGEITLYQELLLPIYRNPCTHNYMYYRSTIIFCRFKEPSETGFKFHLEKEQKNHCFQNECCNLSLSNARVIDL